jgi:hypothetical protein
MSGEAGAELASHYYSIFIGTGITEGVAVPPDADDDYLGRYFADASAPYERWLARALADLDALFARLLGEGRLPLLPIATPSKQIDGAIGGGGSRSEEEMLDEHFRQHSRGEPLAVQVSGYGKLEAFGSLHLRLVVATRVNQAALEAALDDVASVLRAHSAEPKPPPKPNSPPRPPPREGWLARVRARLRTCGACSSPSAPFTRATWWCCARRRSSIASTTSR